MTMPVVFDPFTDAAIADPYSQYAALRAADPVHWSERLRAWIVFRHDDVGALLRDDARFSADRRRASRPASLGILLRSGRKCGERPGWARSVNLHETAFEGKCSLRPVSRRRPVRSRFVVGGDGWRADGTYAARRSRGSVTVPGVAIARRVASAR